MQTDKRFPNETAEYRAAREKLLQAEFELDAQVQKVAALRRQLPLGGALPQDYEFEQMDAAGGVRKVRMSELFAAANDTLLIYSFMYGPQMQQPCPSCSSIIDGLNASEPRLRERVSMAVVARSPIDRVMQFARQRGWNDIPLLSCAHSPYAHDYWGEDEKAQHGSNDQPMMNVFVKREGTVRHFWGSEMLYARTSGDPRHADMFWPLWNLLDLTPQGRGTDWHPRLEPMPQTARV